MISTVFVQSPGMAYRFLDAVGEFLENSLKQSVSPTVSAEYFRKVGEISDLL